MQFLTMISVFLRGLVTVPIKLVGALFDLRMLRMTTAKGAEVLQEEAAPLSAVGRFFRAMGIILFLFITVAIIGGTLWFLWYLNRTLELDRYLGGPWPGLRQVWLPVIFVLFCVLCVHAFLLWRLLGPESEDLTFPGVDAAWTEAKLALEESSISLKETPLFLVLGQPVGSVDAVFHASQMPFPVRQIPRAGDAPLCVYANRAAIFVAVRGSSLLGRQAELLASDDTAPEIDHPEAPSGSNSLFSEDDEAALASAAAAASAGPAVDPLLGGENLLAAEMSGTSGGTATLAATPLVRISETEQRLARRRQRLSLLKRTDEMQVLSAQLRRICQLIVHDRQPYCPLNGLLLLVPYAATDSDEDASQTASLCQQDLEIIRTILRIDCPLFSLISDLETATGFCEMLERIPAGRRQRYLGVTFPLRPDLKPPEVPGMIEGGVRWLCASLSLLVARFFHLEEGEIETRAVAARVNYRLYQLVSAIQQRERRLSALLRRLAIRDSGSPAPFGGAYLAATGPDTEREQAFVAEVFRQLLENQNVVSWTPDALAEDVVYRRLTLYGYAALSVFVVVVLGLMYWKWRTGLFDV